MNNILMIAYTNYHSDPRVIREAETLASCYNVDFLCLRDTNGKSEEYINNVHIIHLNQIRYRGNNQLKYLLSYFIFFLRVFFYALLSKKKYILVHVNNMPDFFVFAALPLKLKGAKVILDIHDPMTVTYRTKFKLKFNSIVYKLILFEERFSCWFADKILTVHEPIKKDILIKEDGLPESKIEVIANFADEKIFKLVEQYNVLGTLKVVFHGTIAERFGLAEVIEELSLINYGNFDFTIIGEGDYSRVLKDLIKRLDLNNKINFINKFYPVKELPNILKGYHLGLVSYKISDATQYMLPLKFLEYFSMGIPALCIRNKAILYYFNEDDAFFFNLEKKGELRELILRILRNRKLLEEKRQKIIAKREKFYWENEAIKYKNIVKSLIGD